jgi:ketosteroid isomerase-like protein
MRYFAFVGGPMVRTLLFLVVMAACSPAARSEDIPLESCDRLPVVQVRISGMKFLFLVDTAAVSTLNLKSFAHGDPTKAAVSSWSGTVQTNAQDVVVADLAIGQHHLKNVRLLAVDLSAIGRACGRSIDGILGIDLLSTLGATVDLKRPAPRLLLDPETAQARVAQLERQITACQDAFNRADEAAFADCLDDQIVLFAVGGDFYGREAAMEYYRQRYFRHNPPPQLALTSRGHHLIGEAIWVEYDLRITVGEQVVRARGSALCQKQDGKWRMVHMNHSNPATKETQAQEKR